MIRYICDLITPFFLLQVAHVSSRVQSLEAQLADALAHAAQADKRITAAQAESEARVRKALKEAARDRAQWPPDALAEVRARGVAGWVVA